MLFAVCPANLIAVSREHPSRVKIRRAMMGEIERIEIARLWERKLRQDEMNLSRAERHRNLEPASAEFLCSLAAGLGAKRILEIGGSSGLSTIALAAGARQIEGMVTSIEIEPNRQAEAQARISHLGLGPFVDFILGDAEEVLEGIGEFDFVFIDCEKDDYIRFFDLLEVPTGGVVVADNVISHSLTEYVAHVRRKPGVESITLPIGKGLEVTHFRLPSRG
jgi:predicted O-methyltransferase YrrM